MTRLVVLCADVGSVRSNRFGWACGEPGKGVREDRCGSTPAELAETVANELLEGRPVALGFECPLFVPVTNSDRQLGAARPGEGNRPWSAGAGTGALATGLVQTAWVLEALHRQCPETSLYFDWGAFAQTTGSALLIWEAFVTATAKGVSHVDDASIAVASFLRALPNPDEASSVSAERPLSLAGAAAIWSGWLQDPQALHASTLVIRS